MNLWVNFHPLHMVKVTRVPYDEGDAPPPPPPHPKRGKERTEYPGGARSAILASSPAGRSQVSVSSVMSMLLSSIKVDMSDLLPDVPTDLALKRQTRSVFWLGKNRGECEAAVCEGDAADRWARMLRGRHGHWVEILFHSSCLQVKKKKKKNETCNICVRVREHCKFKMQLIFVCKRKTALC